MFTSIKALPEIPPNASPFTASNKVRADRGSVSRSASDDTEGSGLNGRVSQFGRAAAPRAAVLSLFIIMNAPMAQPAAAPLAADLILFNGNLQTMDANHPAAQAVAIIANRIAAVGTTDEIRALA